MAATKFQGKISGSHTTKYTSAFRSKVLLSELRGDDIKTTSTIETDNFNEEIITISFFKFDYVTKNWDWVSEQKFKK